jgi:hypothetical protein
MTPDQGYRETRISGRSGRQSFHELERLGEYKFARLLDAGEPGVLSALLSHRSTQKVAEQPASLIRQWGGTVAVVAASPYRDSASTVFLNRSAVLEKTVGQVTQGDRSWPRRSISVCFTVKGLRGW